LKLQGKSVSFTAMAAGLIGICIIIDGSCYSEIMKSGSLDRELSRIYISASELYLPKDMNCEPYSRLETSMPETTITVYPENACTIEKRGTTESNDKVFYVKETYTDCMISLPIAYYDYLAAYDAFTGKKLNTEKGTDGRFTVHLEKGYAGKLIVSYKVRGLWKASYTVSFSFCIGVFIVFFRKEKIVIPNPKSNTSQQATRHQN